MPNTEIKTIAKSGGKKLCQFCYHENEVDALHCAHCGASLVLDTTILVPEAPITGESRASRISDLVKMHEDGLVLYVMGRDQPVIIKGQGKVSLGRRSVLSAGSAQNREQSPNLDLTKYNGHLLGVSRRHAIIAATENGFTIEDLNSTNGTFVNETRLAPNQPHSLRNGDLIRLGQLMLFAYFGAKTRQPPAMPVEQPLILGAPMQPLFPSGSGTNGILLSQLIQRVMPYLQAIAGLQLIIDEVLERDVSEMRIKSVTADPAGVFVNVMMVGYPEAIQTLRTTIMPWKRNQAAAARRGPDAETSSQKPATTTIVLPEDQPDAKPEDAKAAAPPSETVDETETITQPEDKSDASTQNGAVRLEIQNGLVKLAEDILANFVVDLTDARKQSLVKKLVPHLHALTINTIEVAGV